MKALVVYSSKSGNTKKLAEALFGALQCEKDLLSSLFQKDFRQQKNGVFLFNILK